MWHNLKVKLRPKLHSCNKCSRVMWILEACFHFDSRSKVETKRRVGVGNDWSPFDAARKMRVVVIQHILLSSSTSPSASGAWTERQVQRRAARGFWCSWVRALSHLNTRIGTGSSLHFFFFWAPFAIPDAHPPPFFSKTCVWRLKHP